MTTPNAPVRKLPITYWKDQFNPKPSFNTLDEVYQRLVDFDIGDAESDAGLLLDPVMLDDVYVGGERVEMVLDALVVQASQMKRKMTQIARIMNSASKEIDVSTDVIVSDPVKRNGGAHQAVVMNLSDGQTVTIMFHNPDANPSKINPDDELISWKWMLNRLDVTIVVAPERGKDVNPREIGRRIMKLAEKNSKKFQANNAKKAATAKELADLGVEIEGKEKKLEGLKAELEQVKIEFERREEERANLEASSDETEVKEQEEPIESQDKPNKPESSSGINYIPVKEFRREIEALERVYNVDRPACKGDEELAVNAGILERRLKELKKTGCKRAKQADRESYSSIIANVEGYLQGREVEGSTVNSDANEIDQHGENGTEGLVDLDHQESKLAVELDASSLGKTVTDQKKLSKKLDDKEIAYLSRDEYQDEINSGKRIGRSLEKMKDSLVGHQNDLEGVKSGRIRSNKITGYGGGGKAVAIRWLESQITDLEKAISSNGVDYLVNARNYLRYLKKTLEVSGENVSPKGKAELEFPLEKYRIGKSSTEYLVKIIPFVGGHFSDSEIQEAISWIESKGLEAYQKDGSIIATSTTSSVNESIRSSNVMNIIPEPDYVTKKDIERDEKTKQSEIEKDERNNKFQNYLETTEGGQYVLKNLPQDSSIAGRYDVARFINGDTKKFESIWNPRWEESFLGILGFSSFDEMASAANGNVNEIMNLFKGVFESQKSDSITKQSSKDDVSGDITSRIEALRTIPIDQYSDAMDKVIQDLETSGEIDQYESLLEEIDQSRNKEFIDWAKSKLESV